MPPRTSSNSPDLEATGSFHDFEGLVAMVAAVGGTNELAAAYPVLDRAVQGPGLDLMPDVDLGLRLRDADPICARIAWPERQGVKTDAGVCVNKGQVNTRWRACRTEAASS